MSTLFNIGVNGLRAQQTALNVTGQNITNASTPGYSRQRADIVSATGSLSNGVFSGSGARVERVVRVADEFIINQIRTDQALSSELEAFSRSVGQLERALYDDGAGIDSAMREFFDALQSASNNPLDTAARQFVIGQGVALSERINGVAQRIEQQGVDINGGLRAASSRVNEIAGLVAETNRRIALLQDARDSDGLNVMIDQRDNLLKELASWVGVQTSNQADGQVNVFIGKGQSLVLGGQHSNLSVADSGEIFLRQAGTSVDQKVTTSLSGGEMGGLLGYRSGVLGQAQNELGHLAASISYAFNAQHQLGIDLDGNFGGEFFRDLNDPSLVRQRVGVLPGEAGSSDIGQVEVYIDDPLTYPPSNYALQVGEDGSFAIKREIDGAVVYQGANLVPPTSIEFDGIRVEFTDGRFNPGDALLLKPYTAFATEVDVVLTDPTTLALGAPVALEAGLANTGSAELSVAEIIDPEHPIFTGDQTLFPPLLIRFVNDSQYEILDNTNPTDPQPLQPDLGLQDYSQGSRNHVLPYIEGTRLISSSGPQVGTFAADPVLVNDLLAGGNGYPAGTVEVATLSEDGSTAIATAAVTAGSSAKDIAAALNNQTGVTANARTELTLTNLVDYTGGTAVELAVNGELISGFSTLSELADAINANDALSSQGIVARSDGESLQLTATQGDDLTLHFQGDPNESVTVNNAKGETALLNGSVAGSYRRLTVGGEVTALVAPNVTISAQLDGVFAANPIHERADFGFDVLLTGNVAPGDEFAISFNADAAGDNRNAEALSRLSEQQLIGDPPASFGSSFAQLILDVGAAASQAEVNRSAAESLLEQSESYRESVSGVNLDEEAANLIRFEQAYNASAQIIAVARDTFNVLLNAF